ncbi:MAG: hypothetical protein ACLFS8_00790, partial [Clostridia bacterium]
NDTCSEDDAGSAGGSLIADCLEPHLTPEFVNRVFWFLIFRARRAGTGLRTLSVIVWGLWNLHQELPPGENAVWDALYRVSMAEMWEHVAVNDGGSERGDGIGSMVDSSERVGIMQLRNSSERAAQALISGKLDLDLPLFCIINGAVRLRNLMANPDFPGYETLFDAREWRLWGEHPITRHMRTPMKRDWQRFLPEFKGFLGQWLDSEGAVDDGFVASVMSMFSLLECHGLPELDDLLAVIYTASVRDTLSQKRPGPGVSAILEKDYARLLRYAQDLEEWGRSEAARHVRRSLLHRSKD